MAIIPEVLYSGKITPADPAYPYGSARNITTPGDGTGTPWVASNLNDIYGFHQALLSAASVVPSGTPDSVQNSQYVDSIRKLTGKLTDGKKYQFLACTIQNTGSGWTILNDGTNAPVGFTGISVNGNGEIELTYGSSFKMGSMSCVTNKDFAYSELTASVATSASKATISLWSPLIFHLNLSNGDVRPAPNRWGSRITAITTGNVCTVVHPATFYWGEDVQVTTIDSNPSVGSISDYVISGSYDTGLTFLGVGSMCGEIKFTGSAWTYTGPMKNIPSIVWTPTHVEVNHEPVESVPLVLTPIWDAHIPQTLNYTNLYFATVFINDSGLLQTSEDIQMKFSFHRPVTVEWNLIKGFVHVRRGYAKVLAPDVSSTATIQVFGVMEIA